MKWSGVMPAITTCFNEHDHVDHAFMANHCRWLIGNGCTGIVALGSLGEGATLSFGEKVAVLENCAESTEGHAPVVAAISSLTTSEAVSLAEAAEEAGCEGLLVLPPYVYQGDWREIKAHVSAVLKATRLPSMLYNNPVSYGTDFTSEHIRELADEHSNLHSVKESSTDARRVSGIRALAGDRLKIFIGVDDAILEGIGVGAVGWVAGLANALPRESVNLFNYGKEGKSDAAFELYRWFLPLLRLDTVPKFVQLVKLVQQELGIGNARVRPPRCPLVGEELETTLRLIRQAVRNRPRASSSDIRQPAS